MSIILCPLWGYKENCWIVHFISQFLFIHTKNPYILISFTFFICTFYDMHYVKNKHYNRIRYKKTNVWGFWFRIFYNWTIYIKSIWFVQYIYTIYIINNWKFDFICQKIWFDLNQLNPFLKVDGIDDWPPALFFGSTLNSLLSQRLRRL